MVRSPHFNDGRSGGETQGAQGTGSPSPLSRKDISWEKTSWKNLETVDIGLRSILVSTLLEDLPTANLTLTL